MKVHKINSDNLREAVAHLRNVQNIEYNLREAVAHLRNVQNIEYGSKSVRDALSILENRVGPAIHEDDWVVFWMDDSAHLKGMTRPDDIPQYLWDALKLESLWAYDANVIQHYCSAEKMRYCYPLGHHTVALQGNSLTFLSCERQEAISEFADAFYNGGDRPDLFNASTVEALTVEDRPFATKKGQEQWEEFQDQDRFTRSAHPGYLNLDDDNDRSRAIVDFLAEYMREA